MSIAYELKMPLSEAWKMSRDELSWWLAFFKYRRELEKKARDRANRAGNKSVNRGF